MAIDTQQDRQSAATVATVWNPPTIVPDGSFNQADRQQIGYCYSGILIGGAVGPTVLDLERGLCRGVAVGGARGVG
jgi:hypothetical protein